MEQEKHPVDERKVRFKTNMLGNRRQTVLWIISITISSFLISAFLCFVSAVIFENLTMFAAFMVLLLITAVNLFSDILGSAVTAADEAPFHAMASRKISGARQSIMLVRNADKVSNLCNDVIGDICGIISGVIAAYIAIRISGGFSADTGRSVAGIVLTGALTALIVGGKAFTKNIAIKHSNLIVFRCGEALGFFQSIFKSSRIKKESPRR